MSQLRTHVVPRFPNVRFFLVDYVTGSIAVSRTAQLSNGYGDFRVLVDSHQAVLDAYEATMGTTVAIDGDRFIRMNEDFKDGSRLIDVLDAVSAD